MQPRAEAANGLPVDTSARAARVRPCPRSRPVRSKMCWNTLTHSVTLDPGFRLDSDLPVMHSVDRSAARFGIRA
jgi:hypothetical protein